VVKRMQSHQINVDNLSECIENIERLRKIHDPRSEGVKIRILFVGESPPRDAPQNFFYSRTSMLYYATFLAFHLRFKVLEQDFLKFFKNSGCYLYDLFKVPGMIIRGREQGGRIRASKFEKEKAKENLMKFILSERPEVVIVVIKRVFHEIESLLRKLKEQGIIREYFGLPFPKDAPSFTKYVNELFPILSHLSNSIQATTRMSLRHNYNRHSSSPR